MIWLWKNGLVGSYKWGTETGGSGNVKTATTTNGKLYVYVEKTSTSGVSGLYAKCQIYTGSTSTAGVSIDVRRYTQIHVMVSDFSRYHMYDSDWADVVVNSGLADECHVDLRGPSEGNDGPTGEAVGDITNVSTLSKLWVWTTNMNKSGATAAVLELGVTQIWLE